MEVPHSREANPYGFSMAQNEFLEGRRRLPECVVFYFRILAF